MSVLNLLAQISGNSENIVYTVQESIPAARKRYLTRFIAENANRALMDPSIRVSRDLYIAELASM